MVDERITELLVELLGVEYGDVVPDATLASLGADSLDAIEIEMAMEDLFGVDIVRGDVNEATTVARLCEIAGLA